jgi:hypothetical protein
MVQDMRSFLSEYFSIEVLVLHANRCRAAKSSSPRGPPSSRSWYPPRYWVQGGSYDNVWRVGVGT